MLMLSGLSVALAIHSLHLYHRPASTPVPHWQVKFTRFVLLLMGMRRTCRQGRVQEGPAGHAPSSLRQHVSSDDRKSVLHYWNNNTVSSSSVGDDATVVTSQAHKDGEMTWQEVARAYDSFFLRFYFLVIFCSSISFLFGVTADRF